MVKRYFFIIRHAIKMIIDDNTLVTEVQWKKVKCMKMSVNYFNGLLKYIAI